MHLRSPSAAASPTATRFLEMGTDSPVSIASITFGFGGGGAGGLGQRAGVVLLGAWFGVLRGGPSQKTAARPNLATSKRARTPDRN
jgi:hypothetical protein